MNWKNPVDGDVTMLVKSFQETSGLRAGVHWMIYRDVTPLNHFNWMPLVTAATDNAGAGCGTSSSDKPSTTRKNWNGDGMGTGYTRKPFVAVSVRVNDAAYQFVPLRF